MSSRKKIAVFSWGLSLIALSAALMLISKIMFRYAIVASAVFLLLFITSIVLSVMAAKAERENLLSKREISVTKKDTNTAEDKTETSKEPQADKQPTDTIQASNKIMAAYLSYKEANPELKLRIRDVKDDDPAMKGALLLNKYKIASHFAADTVIEGTTLTFRDAGFYEEGSRKPSFAGMFMRAKLPSPVNGDYIVCNKNFSSGVIIDFLKSEDYSMAKKDDLLIFIRKEISDKALIGNIVAMHKQADSIFTRDIKNGETLIHVRRNAADIIIEGNMSDIKNPAVLMDKVKEYAAKF